MKKQGFILLSALLVGNNIFSQEVKDSLKDIQEVIVTGKAPISKEKIVSKQLENRNLGQDLPILLKNNLSVVTTSDAGAGVGYTGIRIRGTDQTRINVTLDGVPVNDGESQGVFWVDLPDLASSVSAITIQRGVGTSTEGSGSFGASMNVETQKPSDTPFFQTDQSVGSFNTHKHNFGLGTGTFFNGTMKADARISFVKSDGYIDRASSDLFSYFFNGSYTKNRTQLSFLAFGGKETTYQAWNGIDRETMKKDRTFNSAGAIYDENYNIVRFYNNQVDDYRQDHYHLSLNQKLNDRWNLKSTLFYVKGKGYYEEYKQGALANYKLANVIIGLDTITHTDLIRRQWLDNNFYGLSNQLSGHYDQWDYEFGLGVNLYEGKHYGKVIWARNFSDSEINHEYYRNKAWKNEVSGYAKALYRVDKKWQLFGDIQYRNVHYNGHDLSGGESVYKNGGALNFSKNYDFINPKAGASYKTKQGDIYLTYGIAQREPNRDDVLDNPEVKSELMHNVEFGVRQTVEKFSYSANAYGMYYINQLVLTGELTDTGKPIRANSGESYRTGIELVASYQFTPKFQISANSTFSINKNIDFQIETDAGEVKNLGNTDISFSPNYVGNLVLRWNPAENINLQWVNQYVGRQYLTNEELKNAKLDSYFTSDLLLEYSPNWLNIKNLSFKLMLNNIFNNLYESNGSYYDGTAYYYPQAGFNFLTGVSLKF